MRGRELYLRWLREQLILVVRNPGGHAVVHVEARPRRVRVGRVVRRVMHPEAGRGVRHGSEVRGGWRRRAASQLHGTRLWGTRRGAEWLNQHWAFVEFVLNCTDRLVLSDDCVRSH